MVIGSPGSATPEPGLGVLHVDRDAPGGRVDDVLGRDADVGGLEDLPGSVFGASVPTRIFSGRMPTATRPVRPFSASG